MVEQNVDTLLTAIGSVVTTLLGAAFWIRKQKPSFAKDDLATKQAEADMGIIGRLEKQNDRLSEQVDRLGSQVNQFQFEVIKLQGENSKLSHENNALREENLSLREEIMDLRKEIKELTSMVMQLQQTPAMCATCDKNV